MSGDDVAARILSDLFGARAIEEDYRCYQEFRDEVIAPRLDEASWSLTEVEIREWKDRYRQEVRPRSARPPGEDEFVPVRRAASPARWAVGTAARSAVATTSPT